MTSRVGFWQGFSLLMHGSVAPLPRPRHRHPPFMMRLRSVLSRLTCCIAALVFCLLSESHAIAQFQSFPGALGFGGTTAGAFLVVGGTSHSGGNVYHVTNLNDSGPGSFRYGAGGGGNIIVFDVGGSIQNLSPCVVQSNVTIEGQTAPGGIQIFGSETSMFGHGNIICRYVHFRDGTLDPNYPGQNGTQSSTNAVNMGDTHDIIMDHCSFEFAAYNNVDSAGAVNITFQNCIFADPIKEQQFNCHFETGPVTFIGNLWANAHGRSPLGKANLQFINNVVYDYGYAMDTGNSAGKFLWDVFNNLFIAGPATTNSSDAYYQVDGNQSAYASGNYMDGSKDGTLNPAPDNGVNNATVLPSPWNATSAALATLTATAAFYDVLSTAGPVPRDPVDSQVVSNVLSLGTQGGFWVTQESTGLGNNGYGVIISGTALPDSDESGMPDDWKAAMGLSLTNPAVSGVTASNGYTNLENYLSWKAQPNAWVAKNTAALPTSVRIDLSQYANGFGVGSTFAVSETVNGTVTPMTGTQSSTGDFIVTFTPKLNTSGLGGFNWSVTNGVTTISSTCGVLISQFGPSQSVRWKGDGVTNAWDSTSPNWTALSSGSAVTFAAGDPITFDDSGSSSPAVHLATPVSPGLIEVDGSTSNYVISGTAGIGGPAAVIKNSAGSLTFQNTVDNTFSGGIVVNSGTLILSQGVGSGPITLADGTLLNFNSVGVGANTLNVTGSASATGASGAGIGGITGAGSLTLLPAGTRFDMGGNIGPFTGTINIPSSTSLRFNGSFGSATAAFNLGSGGSLIYPRNGDNATFSVGSLTGGPNATLGGASDGANMVWSIGGNNATTTFSGAIGGGGMSITKVGTGTLTITGTNSSYTGTTTVNGGLLQLLAPQGDSNFVVNSGGSLLVSGTYNAGTVNSGGTLYLGNSTMPGSVGPLTTGTTFTVAGGTAGANLYYDLSSSPTATGSNDQITVNAGTISLSGVLNFNINMTSGQLGIGTYYLIKGNVPLGVGGLTLNTNIPPTTRGNIFIFRPASGTNPGYIALNVSGFASALTWTGTNGAIWDLNTTSSDWSGASPSTFYNLDTVTFDDTDTNGTVSLSGTLQANVINVNNNTTNYTFTGTGGFAGNAQLIKSGSGSLTIADGPNNTNGNIYLNGGTVYAEAWLGNGIIYLNGGTLTVANGTFLGNPIVVETNSTINAIGGSDWITNNIGASLTSTGPVTLNVVVANGSALTIPGAMDGFQGTFEMGASAGLVRFNGDGSSQALFDIGTSSGSFANRNGGATVNFGGLEGGPNTSLGGRQSGDGPSSSTYVVGALNTDETFAGAILTGGDLGGLNITKVGTGNWTLSGSSNFIGNISVAAGKLTISGSDNNGGLNFEVFSGASLALAGGTISTEVVQIDLGSVFTGYGTIDGNLTNQGTANLTSCGTLTVNGDFENDGTMTIGGSNTLVVNLPTDGSGSFVNNGLLDIMDSPQTVLPAGYVNNGTILDSSLVGVRSFSKAGNTFSVSISSYSGHMYQLEKSANLSVGSWENVGAAQPGSTGSVLILSDTNARSAGAIYKIGVAP
jgi:autotransporter-associated beta strand protein